MEKTRVLLGINLYKFNSIEVAKYNQPNTYPLPEYCLRLDTGKVTQTQFYLQFITNVNESSDNIRDYYLFDIVPTHTVLHSLIEDSGLEDVVVEDLREILCNRFHAYTEVDFRRVIPDTQYLVIEMDYSVECEDSPKVIGYLTDEMKLEILDASKL